MAPSQDIGDGSMKRASLVALLAGLVISSAAALDIAGSREPAIPGDPIHEARTREAAREEQRNRIEERYRVEREACAAIKGGYPREKCIVKAHANKGRALLAAAAPYDQRY
jgi:hypothetical protein